MTIAAVIAKDTMSEVLEFDKTYVETIGNVSFGSFPQEVLNELFRDGRISSHFMERHVAYKFGLKHIPGCKTHDMEDPSDSSIKYEEKTFTAGGCKIMSSSMIGTGRNFNATTFQERAKRLIYVIVSVVNFPEIKIRFFKGEDLALQFPNGEIKFSQHDALFRV